MLMVTTDSIVGKEIVEVKGLVKGSTVRSKHIGKDIGASLKTIVGGELNGYNEMMSSAVMAGAAEMVAYGTAVVVR